MFNTMFKPGVYLTDLIRKPNHLDDKVTQASNMYSGSNELN